MRQNILEPQQERSNPTNLIWVKTETTQKPLGEWPEFYILDASHKIDYKNSENQEDMSYIEKTINILDTKVMMLRLKTIPRMKVL